MQISRMEQKYSVSQIGKHLHYLKCCAEQLEQVTPSNAKQSINWFALLANRYVSSLPELKQPVARFLMEHEF